MLTDEQRKLFEEAIGLHAKDGFARHGTVLSAYRALGGDHNTRFPLPVLEENGYEYTFDDGGVLLIRVPKHITPPKFQFHAAVERAYEIAIERTKLDDENLETFMERLSQGWIDYNKFNGALLSLLPHHERVKGNKLRDKLQRNGWDIKDEPIRGGGRRPYIRRLPDEFIPRNVKYELPSGIKPLTQQFPSLGAVYYTIGKQSRSLIEHGTKVTVAHSQRPNDKEFYIYDRNKDRWLVEGSERLMPEAEYDNRTMRHVVKR